MLLRYQAQRSRYFIKSLPSGVGCPGSLLFWLWILTVVGAIVVWQGRQRNEETHDTLADHALIPIVVVQLFFTILVTGLIEGIYNPLARFPNGQVAADGQGMNPLLQTPLMAIHPPTLYVGWISLDGTVCVCSWVHLHREGLEASGYCVPGGGHFSLGLS